MDIREDLAVGTLPLLDLPVVESLGIGLLENPPVTFVLWRTRKAWLRWEKKKKKIRHWN